MNVTRIIGIDPSLVACGWGVIDKAGSKLTHVGNGVIRPPAKEPLASRLHFIFAALTEIIDEYKPSESGVEQAFMKDNAMSALKLGQARAACILAATTNGLNVGEYAAKVVKKSVVGTGAADKAQVAHMINLLLPGAHVKAGDAADALAIAITHGNSYVAVAQLARRAG
ncbi:crossover junction endodeoxyribonuclease RuvC [Litorimonas cladophorae]|uniref:Crossover junction endodeoxyribonuclease RuvC n=1 Tax=Litorimonas cladophorae TaxID=1220491 RepID=A0A918KAY1_9PROT|nr:crossover junction endodeoxyribonuclease RuvC [Litorimonas cladophorae]GGX56596.1 crossover junction endodeoxyribonuclease RuvC [Litorimonas cladophorae]